MPASDGELFTAFIAGIIIGAFLMHAMHVWRSVNRREHLRAMRQADAAFDRMTKAAFDRYRDLQGPVR
jgi:hypothetical protein